MPDCGARPTAHEVLAAVLQIRDGTLQVLAWRRAQAAGRRSLGAARRAARRRRGRRGVGAPAARGEGRRPRGRPRRAARGVQRPATGARARGASPPPSSGSSPPTPTRPCPPTPPGTPSTPCRDPAFDHAEIVAAAQRAAARQALLHQPRVRPGPPRVHDLHAARALRRRARPPGVGDEPAAGARAPRRAGADGRRSRRPGPAGGRPAALFRFAEPTLRVTDAFAVLQAARRAGPGGLTVSDVVANLPLFPLSTVLMPGAPLPLHIFEPRYRQLTVDLVTGAVPGKAVRRRRRPRGLADGDETAVLHGVGCTAELLDVRRLPDGRYDIVTRGCRRFRLLDVDTEARPYLMAEVEYLPDRPRGARGRPRRASPVRPAPPTGATAPRRGRAATGPSPPTTSGRPSCPTCSPPTACCPCRTASACWSRPRPAIRLRMVRALLIREAGLLGDAARRPRPAAHLHGGRQPELTGAPSVAFRTGECCDAFTDAEARSGIRSSRSATRSSSATRSNRLSSAPRPPAGSRARRPR